MNTVLQSTTRHVSSLLRSQSIGKTQLCAFSIKNHQTLRKSFNTIIKFSLIPQSNQKFIKASSYAQKQQMKCYSSEDVERWTDEDIKHVVDSDKLVVFMKG